jgi:quaternary ammonium compound-resistance protein SugE
MAWTMLFGAGLLEIVWAIALKCTGGFTRFWPSAIGVSAAVVSFLMLSIALKSLPVGTAYAVWVGIGALGVALAGDRRARRERLAVPGGFSHADPAWNRRPEGRRGLDPSGRCRKLERRSPATP